MTHSTLSPAADAAGDALSFISFAKAVYPFLELEPFHEAYYRVLEAFAHRYIRKLIVTMPPQHGKSTGSTTLLPAYLLGLDPDLKVAIASYSSSFASRFNRRVQRIIDSKAYAAIFPQTTIKHRGKPQEYIRTAEEVEIIGRHGNLISVGRGGALTGNRVDCFILDDLYKNAMESHSPVVRENCWDWYLSVVKTRLHNASSELVVFTRWHAEDLIAQLSEREKVLPLTDWAQLENPDPDVWFHLNFEALKTTPATSIDPRQEGQALWESQHGVELLRAKRALDPHQFDCMYQGFPSSDDDLLYGTHFLTYTELPRPVVERNNYTDTADMGDDYLCSVSYVTDLQGFVYIIDVVYSREPMEVTERLVADMLLRSDTQQAQVESNNGGRGFARSLQLKTPNTKIKWFHQSGNKEARILSNASMLKQIIRMPSDWFLRWPDFYAHLTTYRRIFRSNRWHDAADVLTGIVEKEFSRGKKDGAGFLPSPEKKFYE